MNNISNDLANTITSELGDMLIQNGGDQSVPSLISTLTVNLTRDPLMTTSRLYSCFSSQINMQQNITLSEYRCIAIHADISTYNYVNNYNTVSCIAMLPVTAGPPIPCKSACGLNILIPVGIAIGAIVVILIIAVIIAIISRHFRQTKITEHEGNLGEQVPVEENEAYRVTPIENGVDSVTITRENENESAFNMTQNTLYGAESAEEVTEEDNEEHNYEDLETMTL